MKYFAACTTLDELKKEYRRLAMIHHPDHGGDTATMQAINGEYAETFARTMEDGTQTRELREVYPGKERKKAFTRFEALQKQFPGIPAEKDIEKKYWEK